MEYTKFSHPASEPKKFSIVIPTWNNLKMVRFFVESIRKNSAFKHQIIVHVNDGSDGTLDWVRAQPDIDYTYSPENIGICYAMNLAASLVRTDYIVYINDDMYVCPAWDRPFAEEIARIGHPYFFLSGVLVEPYLSTNKNAVVTDFGSNPDDFEEKKFLEYYAAMPKTNHLGAIYPPNIVHRDVWNMVGGYSVEFSPGFGSDPDFAAKLWKLGVRHFKVLGASAVYHFGKASTSRISQPSARATYLLKWGHTFRTLRNNLHYGTPITAQNENLLSDATFKVRFADRIKTLHCALRYLFGKQCKLQ